jgi:hypothetical protein
MLLIINSQFKIHNYLAYPYLAGEVVYKAREIFALKSPAHYYNDLKICNAQGYYRTTSENNLSKQLKEMNAFAKNTSDKTEQAFIYPNPANGRTLILKWSPKENESGTIDLYNIMGVKVFSVSIYENSNSFNLSQLNLSSGIYTYEINTNKSKRTIGKLIIIK